MLIDISVYLYIYIYPGSRGLETSVRNLSITGVPGVPLRSFNDFLGLYIVAIKEPRGVIWNSVVRASFFKVCFTINSKYHVFDMIFSASILTFSCGSNGMGPNILFSAICEVRGGFDFPKGVFSRNKRICS